MLSSELMNRPIASFCLCLLFVCVFCRYTDNTQLLTAIESVPYPAWGDLSEPSPLSVIVDGIFVTTAGDRPLVREVVVLITDGFDNHDYFGAATVSTTLQAKGIKVFVVCNELGCSETYAEIYASPPP